jgi:hypothetical protein
MIDSQKQSLTQKLGFKPSAMLAPLPPLLLQPIAETESSFERQTAGSNSIGVSPTTVSDLSPLVGSSLPGGKV